MRGNTFNVSVLKKSIVVGTTSSQDDQATQAALPEGKAVQKKSSQHEYFDFLELPAELRNSIYYYVFKDHEFRFYRGSTSYWKHGLGLLFVNRQIHSEVAWLPYRYSRFSFKDARPNARLDDFLVQRTAKQIQEIKRLSAHQKTTYRIPGRIQLHEDTGLYWLKECKPEHYKAIMQDDKVEQKRALTRIKGRKIKLF